MYFMYFLSVMTNLIAGIFLISEPQAKNSPLAHILNAENWRKQGVVLLFSAVTLIVGVIKIVSVTSGDVKILGDILPALAGMVQGIVLFLLYGTKKKEEFSKDISTVLSLHKTIGYISILIAIFHALFPAVLFL